MGRGRGDPLATLTATRKAATLCHAEASAAVLTHPCRISKVSVSKTEVEAKADTEHF